MSEIEAPRPTNTKSLHAHADYATAIKYATDRYLQYCDPTIDLQYVNILVVKLVIIQKVLLSAMPMRRNASHTSHVDDVVFSQAIEVLEIGHQLSTNLRALPWSWSNRVHWHSFGVVLAKLCVEPNSKLATRAWNVVEGSFIQYGKKVADSEKGMLWRPLEKLMIAARQARAKMEGLTTPTAIVNKTAPDTSSQQPVQHHTNLNASNPAPTAWTQYTPTNEPATSTALTTDFDMLSFQDPAQSNLDDLNMTYNDPAMTSNNDTNGALWSGWDWSTFVDDMNTNYLQADDFADISFEPTLPIYQRNYGKDFSNARNMPAF